MTFLINPATLPFKHDARMEAVELWRTAERLVAERWAQYSTAGRNQASAAYNAYLAALDAEEAAADELRQLNLSKAA
jgi:hypothetical protein